VGKNLLGTSSVSFHGTPATIVSVAAGSVKALVPGAATTGTVSVTTPGGTAISLKSFTVT
jgi:hypothetical protein